MSSATTRQPKSDLPFGRAIDEGKLEKFLAFAGKYFPKTQSIFDAHTSAIVEEVCRSRNIHPSMYVGGLLTGVNYCTGKLVTFRCYDENQAPMIVTSHLCTVTLAWSGQGKTQGLEAFRSARTYAEVHIQDRLQLSRVPQSNSHLPRYILLAPSILARIRKIDNSGQSDATPATNYQQLGFDCGAVTFEGLFKLASASDGNQLWLLDELQSMNGTFGAYKVRHRAWHHLSLTCSTTYLSRPDRSVHMWTSSGFHNYHLIC